ncbi:hypothetical protein ACJJTC_014535 [Scirpophaga incertulas]
MHKTVLFKQTRATILENSIRRIFVSGGDPFRALLHLMSRFFLNEDGRQNGKCLFPPQQSTDVSGSVISARSVYGPERGVFKRLAIELRNSLTALREHWDEANARVLQRKAQLDAMLGDSQRYEARRRDADAWLARMESRLAGMTPPGHTADVLELQLREQKSFHAEVHQYKHQIELFGQLTQRLIAVYRNDDTTRIKRATEAINHRYNELNNSIIARGKALNSAVSSLQNFDRSLEKFVGWLSEAESLLDAAERDPQMLKVSYTKKYAEIFEAVWPIPICN